MVTTGYIDSIARRSNSERKDFSRRNALDSTNLIALKVHTLDGAPDSLVLAVGDSVPLFGGPISWVARDDAGLPIPDFAPWFRVDNSRVAGIHGD